MPVSALGAEMAVVQLLGMLGSHRQPCEGCRACPVLPSIALLPTSLPAFAAVRCCARLWLPAVASKDANCAALLSFPTGRLLLRVLPQAAESGAAGGCALGLPTWLGDCAAGEQEEGSPGRGGGGWGLQSMLRRSVCMQGNGPLSGCTWRSGALAPAMQRCIGLGWLG